MARIASVQHSVWGTPNAKTSLWLRFLLAGDDKMVSGHIFYIFFRSQQLLWGGYLPHYLAYLSQHQSGQVAAQCLVFIVWKTCLMHSSVLYSPAGLRGKGTVVVIRCNLFAVLLLECRVFCWWVVWAGGCTGCGPSDHDMKNLFLNAAAGSGPSLLIWNIS